MWDALFSFWAPTPPAGESSLARFARLTYVGKSANGTYRLVISGEILPTQSSSYLTLVGGVGGDPTSFITHNPLCFRLKSCPKLFNRRNRHWIN